MENWIIDQIIQGFGGFDKFLEFLPSERVEHVLNGKYINDLPVDLLATVLSYVNSRDVYKIIRVCKLWKDVVFKKHHFWSRLIKSKLLNEFKSFNTFSFSDIEQLKGQVEWVFKPILLRGDDNRKKYLKNLHEIYLFVDDLGRLHRKNRQDGYCLCKTLKDGKELNISILYRSSEFNIEEGSYKMRMDDNYLNVSKWGSDGTGKIVKFEWTYEGDMKYHYTEDIYVPHGNGKWIFNDGFILEGKGVAHLGEPRFIKRK